MSISYSVLNGNMNSIGAGIGLRTGFMNWFVSADYIPFNYIPLPLNKINSDFPVFNALIPTKTSGFNIAFGVNLVLGNRKDADKDGVVDRKDKCPDTPLKVIVDMKGCPVDSDGDSIPDYLDKCANTPKEAYAKIDKNGCPIDEDSDGVPDYLDKCPDTKAGMKVDSIGCPLDADSDGVLDKLDLCPETPLLAQGMIDENGCPVDSDDDGVPDYLDKCPTVKGIASNNGCVEVKAQVKPLNKFDKMKPAVDQELKLLFQKALQGIQFESGNDLILPRSHKILNQIAGVLIANPDYLIEVRGFTDNVGNSKANLILSSKRAIAVKKYLVRKGVEVSRINTNGYGDTLPVATNKTAIGRSINRRVEFIVSFVEITFE